MTELECLASVVDSHAEELFSLAQRLIRVPSISGDEGPVAEVLASWMREHDFGRVEVQTVDEGEVKSRWPEYEHERDLGRRPNVIGVMPTSGDEAGGARVVLNGHMDVVPARPEEWRYPPFEGVRAEGRLWGRGAADMKCGLAAALMAAVVLRDEKVLLPFELEVQCVIGEETGGLGTLALTSTRPVPAAAIVLEPTAGAVVGACGGAQPFTVRVRGKSAHIAASWRGVSAFELLMEAYDALKRLAEERGRTLRHPAFSSEEIEGALAVGTVRAGDWRLTVPGDAELSGRMGCLPGEEIAVVRRAIEATLDHVSPEAELGARPSIGWDGKGFPGWETDSDSLLA